MSDLGGLPANTFTSFTMYPTYFQISKYRRRRLTRKICLYAVLAFELNDAILHFAVKRLEAEENNISRLNIRQRHIVACIFNVHAYADNQCFTNFRFKRSDIAMLCTKSKWPGVRSRKEYFMWRIIALCIILQILNCYEEIWYGTNARIVCTTAVRSLLGTCRAMCGNGWMYTTATSTVSACMSRKVHRSTRWTRLTSWLSNRFHRLYKDYNCTTRRR